MRHFSGGAATCSCRSCRRLRCSWGGDGSERECDGSLVQRDVIDDIAQLGGSFLCGQPILFTVAAGSPHHQHQPSPLLTTPSVPGCDRRRRPCQAVRESTFSLPMHGLLRVPEDVFFSWSSARASSAQCLTHLISAIHQHRH
jgi:hypothetical protein